MLPKTARRLSTSMCRPVSPQEQTSLLRAGTSGFVPIAVVSNCSKLGHYSITSSARASRVGDTSSPSALARPPSPREAYDFVHHAPQLRNRCLLNQGGFKTRPYESTSSNRC